MIERVDEKTELATFMSEVGWEYCFLELTIPQQVVTQFKIADTKKFDKIINTEDQLAALGWEYIGSCDLWDNLMIPREMQRGRVVHNAFIRCKEKNVDLELDTLMVRLIMEKFEFFLITYI